MAANGGARRPRPAPIAGPRPWQVRVVAVWACFLATGLLVAGVWVVVSQLPPFLNDAADRLAARGVLGLGEVLAWVALMLLLGARALWRHARTAVVTVPFVALLLVAVWGAIDGLVERSENSILVAMATLVAGGAPLFLLRAQAVRAWVGAHPWPAAQVSPQVAAWQERLGPATNQRRTVAQIASLVSFLLVIPLVFSWAFAIGASPAAAWVVAGIALAGIVARLIVGVHARRSVRADVAAAHGLPASACRWVNLSDPVLFDKSLERALRTASSAPTAIRESA